jgi:hypothetical protein
MEHQQIEEKKVKTSTRPDGYWSKYSKTYREKKKKIALEKFLQENFKDNNTMEEIRSTLMHTKIIV